MLERGVQHLVCSFSMNNFSRLVEVPFRTQNSSEWNMRNVKVGFRKNEYYQADQLPRFTRYECQSKHLLVQDELEQLSVSSVFWENKFGTKCWERKFGSQTWTKVNRKLHTGERSEPIFGKSYWRSREARKIWTGKIMFSIIIFPCFFLKTFR